MITVTIYHPWHPW